MQRKNINIGKVPTPSQKLIYVADKLKLGGLAGMQGSTVNLFDTALLSTAATTRQTLTFFSNSNGKSRNFSNFQNGQLNAGEAMVIESISFFLVTLSASNLALDATTISTMYPISQVDAAPVSLKEALMLGLLNITIANSRVVKDYFCFEQNPSYNPKTTGIALGEALAGDTEPVAIFPQEVVGQNTIMLESPPVLPPNQKLEITLEMPPIGTVTGNMAMMCVIGRFGSIFAAKTTL
jgi:hypothetical protein